MMCLFELISNVFYSANKLLNTLICSFSVLALYSSIKLYSESLMETSRIKIWPLWSVCCFLTIYFSVQKYAIRTAQKFVFPWEKKTLPWKSSFHFCSTLLFEWVSCKNNNPHGPILLLKYWISFNLFLSDCIPLLVIKLSLLFDRIRSLKVHSQVWDNIAKWNPLKMMKNAFYFNLKDLIGLKIFKFLS